MDTIISILNAKSTFGRNDTQVWRRNADFDGVRFLYWVRNTYESMKFMYNLKDKMVYAITVSSEGTQFFRRAYDSAGWRLLSDSLQRQLRPLVENERMKKNDWRSQYYWELPYGEAYEFREWLQTNFMGSRCSFYLNVNEPGCSNSIYITTSSKTIYNEVREPYIDCSARLPKELLTQVCDIIMHEYYGFVDQNWED